MEQQTYNFPARILDTRAVTPAPVEGAFVWPAEISSDRLDAYFTHMDESSLRNYAADAAAGVTFLDSHNARNLGYGQSLSGVFQVEGGVSRVVSEFYTVPGIRFGGQATYQSTDDFIKAVESRLVRDVSVGFHGGDMVCDICGLSFYDWRNGCQHWPGMEYAVGEQGDKTTVATFAITDAHLAEVSAVYAGATPGAMIMRAQEMSEAGTLAPDMARRLETKYRIKLPAVGVSSRNWPVDGLKVAAKSPERKTIVDELEQIRALASEAGATNENTVEAVRWLVGEISRLAPLADQGRAYRIDLIADTLAAGVRAMGEAFPAETYKGIMERASIEEVKELRANFARQAALRLPAGRQTKDPEPSPVQRPQRVPDAAYQS